MIHRKTHTSYLRIAAVVACGLAALPMWAVGVGDRAPDVQFADREGKSHKLSDFQGRWLFVDIWASWCPPCRHEIPIIETAYKKYASDTFEAIGISVDKKESDWLQAVDDFGMTYPQFHAPGNFTSPVVKAFQIRGIPSTWLIDPEGMIIMSAIRGDAVTDMFERLSKGGADSLGKLAEENRAWSEILTTLRGGSNDAEKTQKLLLVYLERYPDGANSATAQRALFSMGTDLDGKPLVKAKLGKTVPPIGYVSPDGKGHTIEEHRQKWLLLALWQSQAPPTSLRQLQELNSLHREFGKEGAVVLGLSFDSDDAAWKSTLEKLQLSFPQGRADAKGLLRVQAQYAPRRMPGIYLIDPDGKLAASAMDESTDLYTYLYTATQGTDEERNELFGKILLERDRAAMYQRITLMFGKWQAGEATEEEFIKEATAFIQLYPDAPETEDLEILVP